MLKKKNKKMQIPKTPKRTEPFWPKKIPNGDPI
jgi:hypothetical protein